MNLLEETIEVLHKNGKSTHSVSWCGSEKYGWFYWETFAELADREYDNGFGGQEVAVDLLVVGVDWWLERHEYDGSEWWEFKTVPLWPAAPVRCPRKVVSGLWGWSTLKEMNE